VSVLVRARDVHRDYPLDGETVHALRGVSLEIVRGEYVAIVGPSGCGKSSLLNLLGAIDAPTSGSVEIEGREVGGLGDREVTAFRLHHVGFVFQRFYLLPVLTARENIELPMAEAGVPKAARRERAVELLRYVGLEARGRHRPAQLSGGEQQRVAVARALVSDPPLIVADEPTGNLDTETGKALMTLFLDIRSRLGTTILVATHNNDVAAHTDRVLRMRDGRLVPA
jgi:putative ABC transport system ATP-binding protein